MTIEILTQLQAIEDSISEGGIINANQLIKIYELLNDSSFMYLQPTSIKEIGYNVENRLLKEKERHYYKKINDSLVLLKSAGYL